MSSFLFLLNIQDHSLLTANTHSEDSLGLNVSPDAIHEAKRRGQDFSFVPQQSEHEVGLRPPSNFSRNDRMAGNNDDSNGRHDDNNNKAIRYQTFQYDCPPGPLGIIIETTTEGPMVHNVKPKSILNGTLLPGDLIIGLDDNDTSTMTAPQITRLMANKSQQRSRKLRILRAQQ